MAKLIDSGSRLNKSLVNVATGGVLQILTLLLNFVVRIVFVRVIGYSYLGISALFANILTILSVADLGFGTSISISLYSALKKGDKDHIAGILTYYKKIYLIIGGVIFAIGCVLCPFIKYIVNTDTPVQYIEVYFLIYLVNLVSTYFISYRHSIIKADQKNGVINMIHSLVLIAKSIVELLIIVILPRFFDVQVAYITYLIVMVLATYGNEIWAASKAKKMYPYAFVKRDIPKDEKQEISKNVRSLLLYKVCNAVNKSVDSILISILVSTTILGKYSNYTLIVSVLMGFGCLISRNAIASLGNYVLTESKEKQVNMFYIISFVHIAIAAFFVVNYVGILQPFFHLAFGVDSTLSILTLVLTAVHLAFDLNYQVNELFRETTKMFRKIPYISAINLVLNIGLSILLGYYFGLEGIIGGTLIAYFLTSFWFETFALFKFYFKASSRKVWLKLGYAVVSIGAFSTAAFFITSKVDLGDQALQLAFSIIISLVLSAACICSMVWFKEFKKVYVVAKRIVLTIYEKISSFLRKQKVQLLILVASIVSLIVLVAIRDLCGVEIHKLVYVALSLVAGLLLVGDNFIGFFLFLIPFHSGLPTRFIYPIFVVLFILKNLKMFKNWRLIINYFAIPTIVFVLEMVLSTIYGETIPVNDALLIFSALAILSFVIYDKKVISKKPLGLFVLGVASVTLIMLIHWYAIAKYMSAHSPVKDMTLERILTHQRFGNVTGLIEWTEKWTTIKYPYKTSMLLGDNENYVGLLMLSGVMCSSYLVIRKNKINLKIIYGLAALLFVLAGAYTGSKSFFLCILIFLVSFVLMLYAENYIKLWTAVFTIATTALTVTVVCLYVPFVNKFIIERLDNDSGRIGILGAYFEFIFKDPKRALFGVSSYRLMALSNFPEPPHNAIAQIVGGYGLFGFSIIVAGLVLTVMKGRPRIKILSNNILVALSPLAVYLIFTMTSQIFLPPNTLIYGIPIFYIYVVRSNFIVQKEYLNITTYNNKKMEARMMKKLKEKENAKKDMPSYILITGVAGFVGSFLCKKLLETTNYFVVGLDNMNKDYSVSLKKNRLNMFSKNKNFKFINGDISDRDLLDTLFERYNFEIVINLASQTGAQKSMDCPDEYMKTNIIGAYYLLEACRFHPVKHFIYASSAKEDCGPSSFYSATIQSNETFAQTYSRLYSIPTTCLRFFDVYGPMGRPDMEYYQFTDSFAKDEFVDLYNSGESQKDFIYIDDVVDLIINVMDKAPKNSDDSSAPYLIFEVGTGESIYMKDFINVLSEQLKSVGIVPQKFDVKKHIKLVPTQSEGSQKTSADIKELENHLGYKPSTSLEDGLRKFAEWYKEYHV